MRQGRGNAAVKRLACSWPASPRRRLPRGLAPFTVDGCWRTTWAARRTKPSNGAAIPQLSMVIVQVSRSKVSIDTASIAMDPACCETKDENWEDPVHTRMFYLACRCAGSSTRMPAKIAFLRGLSPRGPRWRHLSEVKNGTDLGLPARD